MASWRVAKSLLTLRAQIDAKYPNRSKGNDGTIGDERHQATHSEHNPDQNGVVRAEDITNDPAHGVVSNDIAHALINSRDPRILYVISNGQICSSQVSPWVWRSYSGSNPHDHHFHLSVVSDPKRYDDTSPWAAINGGVVVQPPAPPKPAPFPHSGKGSWYSQYSGKYQWRDTGDAPGSAALGVPDNAQGISFYNHKTLGLWFEVRAPNGVTSIEQQTDIGPHPRTGRAIDISSAAAERFGYSPKTFPTDGTFAWRAVDPPPSVAGLPVKQQAVKYRDLRKATITQDKRGPSISVAVGGGGVAALLFGGAGTHWIIVIGVALAVGISLWLWLRK